MSELKVILATPHPKMKNACDGAIEVYLKSEVDKVIKDIVKGASSMFREFSCCRGLDTKSPLGEIADVAYKHWMRDSITENENKQLKDEKDRLVYNNSQLLDRTLQLEKHVISQERQIRYHKYKRCLAMAQEWRNYAAFCGMQSSCHNHRGFGKTAEKYTWKEIHAWKCVHRYKDFAEKFNEA